MNLFAGLDAILPDPRWLIFVGCQGAFVLSVSLIVVRCIRNQAARTRQRVLTVGLAATLFLPLVSTLFHSSGLHLPIVSEQMVRTGRTNVVSPVENAVRIDDVEKVADTVQASPTHVAIESERGVEFDVDDALSVAMCLWLGGACCIAFVRVHGLVSASFIVRRAGRAPAEIQSAVRATWDSTTAWQPACKVSDSTGVPFVWGWFRPAIVLPNDAEDWTRSHLRMVLIHEMAHIRHCDWLWQQVASLCCVVHWFNPLVWIAANRMKLECECASDELVVQSQSAATDYASMLVSMARRARDQRELRATVAITGVRLLEYRLNRILSSTSPAANNWNRSWLLPLGISLALSCFSLDAPSESPIPMPPSIQPGINDWSTEVSQTIEFPGELKSLSVFGSNGSVRFVEGDELRVDATVIVDESAVDPKELVEGFEGHIQIERTNMGIEIRDLHGIEADRRNEFNPWNVHFVVYLPQSTRIATTIGVGDINLEVEEFRLANVKLDSGNGRINVRALALEGESVLTAGNGNVSLDLSEAGREKSRSTINVGGGNVSLRVPDAGSLTLTTPNGAISQDGRTRSSGFANIELSAGGPAYSVSTGNGNIEFHIKK